MADMMANPLWELIIQWIERCSAGHQLCRHTTRSCLFPTRLVRLNTTDAGHEARLVETGEKGFIREYEPSLSISLLYSLFVVQR